MFDSVMALAHGLVALERGSELRLANLSCDIEQPWIDGSSLFNYINSVSCTAITTSTTTNSIAPFFCHLRPCNLCAIFYL